MKVIKSKDDKITLGRLVDNFGEYMIVADHTDFEEDGIYVLMHISDSYVWVNIVDNSIWDEAYNLSHALQVVDIENLYAFEDYKKFGEWLYNKERI